MNPSDALVWLRVEKSWAKLFFLAMNTFDASGSAWPTASYIPTKVYCINALSIL